MAEHESKKFLSDFESAVRNGDWETIQTYSTKLESLSPETILKLQIPWERVWDPACLQSKPEAITMLAYLYYLEFRFGKSKTMFGWLDTIFPEHDYNSKASGSPDKETSKAAGEQRTTPSKTKSTGNYSSTFSTNNIPGILALAYTFVKDGVTSESHLKHVWQDISSEQQFSDPENHPNAMPIRLREPAYKHVSDTGYNYMSIVMPCFHYHTLGDIDYWRSPKSALERTKLIAEDLDLCSSNSSQYFAVQFALTLDEYCSPALPKSVLDQRNLDQVILKAKGKEVQNTNGKFRRAAHVLAVSQMWLWELEDALIISPSTVRREGRSQAEEPSSSSTSREWIYTEIATRLRNAISWTNDGTSISHRPKLSMDVSSYVEKARNSSTNRNRAIGIMLSEAVDFLEHPSTNHHDREPLFNIYERYVTVVGQRADAYCKNTDLAKVDIDEERKYLHDIDDIRAELAMIKRVISQQEEVWRDFASSTWPEHWPSGREDRMVISKEADYNMGDKERDEWTLIMRPQSQFEKYRRRIGQLDDDSARVERAIIAKLDLKQKHASLREAHAAGVISAAVLGFTVITIIFTPLSFLTSLFALPIDQFQKHQVDWFVPGPRNEMSQTNMTRTYTGNYIGKWAATAEIASVAVAVGAMWLAVEYTVEERLTMKLWNRVQKLLHVQPKPTEEANEQYPDSVEPPPPPTPNGPKLQPGSGPQPGPQPKPEPFSEAKSGSELQPENPNKLKQYFARMSRHRSSEDTERSTV